MQIQPSWVPPSSQPRWLKRPTGTATNRAGTVFETYREHVVCIYIPETIRHSTIPHFERINLKLAMWFVNLLPNLNMYLTSVGALKFEKAYKTLTSPATTHGAIHLTVGLLPVVSGCQLWAAERIRELPLLDLRWRRWEICFGFFHLRQNDAKVLLKMESEVNIAGGGGLLVFFSSFWNRIEGNSLSQEYGLVGWFKPCKLFSKARLPHWAMTGCRISKLIWHLSRLSAGQLWQRSDTSGWYRVPKPLIG